MKPSLNYIYNVIHKIQPEARIADEHAGKFDFEWLSMASADSVGRKGFLYFVEPGVSIRSNVENQVTYACVVGEDDAKRFTGVPRIIVPADCDMASVFDHAVGEVDQFRHWDEAINEILLGETSLKDLIDATYALVPRPMYIADVYWRMLVRVDSGMDEMSSHWLHEIRHGCLATNVIEQLNKSGEYRRIVDSNQAFLVETQAFNLNYIAKAIKYRGRTLGFFFIINIWDDLGPCEIEIADKFGRLLGPVFGLKKENVLGDDFREQGLANLLDNVNVNVKQLAGALAATTGWKMEADWSLAAVRITDEEQRNPLARMRIESLLSGEFDCCVIPGGNASFVAYRNAEDGTEGLLPHLQSCAEAIGRSIVLSGRFFNFATSSQYFRQFKTILKDDGLLDRFEDATVVTYDDLLPALLARWCRRKLPPAFEVDALEAHDAAHNTDYVRTLYTYLLHERNTVATAKALYLHRNSTYNRIEKISNLIDADLDDDQTRFRLLLALNEKINASNG